MAKILCHEVLDRCVTTMENTIVTAEKLMGIAEKEEVIIFSLLRALIISAVFNIVLSYQVWKKDVALKKLAEGANRKTDTNNNEVLFGIPK